MKLLKHVTGQPFVMATGLAALIHSTWSLGTLFAGNEPAVQFSLQWFAWLIPALLIAFALDVGQVVTSAEIRAGQRTRAKYATFVIFAAATYYLQWLYMAHHMPLVDLAAGVRESWQPAASLIRDAGVWILPAMMPLSTLLYTFSHGDDPTPESLRKSSGSSAESLPAAETLRNSPGQPTIASVTDNRYVPTAALSAVNLSPESEPGAALAAVNISSTIEPLAVADDTPLGLQVALGFELAPNVNQVKPFQFICNSCGYTNTYTTDAGRAQGKRAHDRHCAEKYAVTSYGHNS